MSIQNRLLLATPDAVRYQELLLAEKPSDLQITPWPQKNRIPEDIGRFNIILGEPGWVAPLIHQAEGLSWVQSTFAGVDALCSPDLRRDYLLTGVKGIFAPPMAEYVFAHILSLERNLEAIKADQRAKVWGRHDYRGLKDRVMGLCGLGSIGRHIAETASHFGMKVIAYKRTPGQMPAVERIYWGKELNGFLGRVDFLVLILPGTPATTHLINARTLKMMKPSAVLINVGRGNTVAERDLVKALQSGTLRGAILDVFEHEPLPRDHPLWGLPNATITPHNAAVSFPEDIVPIFMENYRRFRNGQSLRYLIDIAKGY
jgi:phosphoglycerate dehydrogenase-like enzyme